MPPKKMIYQIKITLSDIHPSIWRRIQVQSTYTFWDLHVAIQDAMGWFDEHSHVFIVKIETGKNMLFGIPSEEEEDDEFFGEDNTLPSWKHKISKYVGIIPTPFVYDYDFSNDWRHMIDFEEIKPAENGIIYPRCIEGDRACPPEDCGGVWIYPALLPVPADPKHEEHLELKEWVESQTGGPFDPEHFDPAEVEFCDPKEWHKECFDESGNRKQ